MATREIGSADRLLALDAMRFACVTAIVLQHALSPSGHAGVAPSLLTLGWSIWAIPLIFGISGFVTTLGGRTVDLRRRARRILVPYAAWSVLLFAYSVQAAWRAGALSEWLNSLNWLGVVFAGEAYFTLWFLAMLFYLTVLGWALRTDRARVIGAVVGILVYGAIALVRNDMPFLDTDTWGGFLIRLPICATAYLAGAVLPNVPRPRQPLVPIGIAASATVADAVMYATWGTELSEAGRAAFITTGTLAALLALWAFAYASPKGRLLQRFAAAGTFTLGVYAIHAPVLTMVRRITDTRGSTSYAWALALTIIAVAVSLGVSLLMSRVRALRPLVS